MTLCRSSSACELSVRCDESPAIFRSFSANRMCKASNWLCRILFCTHHKMEIMKKKCMLAKLRIVNYEKNSSKNKSNKTLHKFLMKSMHVLLHDNQWQYTNTTMWFTGTSHPSILMIIAKINKNRCWSYRYKFTKHKPLKTQKVNF